MTTTSPIIVPPATITVPGRAGEQPYVRASGSGLWIPGSSGVQTLAARTLVVPPKELWHDLNATSVGAQAREGHRLIAAGSGRAAADILLAPQMRVLDAVAAQERHDAAIKAFFAGRVEYGTSAATKA